MRVLICLFTLIQTIKCQTWTQIADFSGNDRDDGVAVVINNFAYAGTGLATISGISNDFHKLDLTSNSWSSIAPMPAGSNRQYACAFTYSNYLFVTGGITNGNVVLSDSYRYDVNMNVWTTVAAKPGNGVWGASSITLGSKAYIVGGKYSNGNVSDEVWQYDMVSNTWTQKNNFPFGARWRASSSVINNIPYLIFGLDNNGSYRKEIYKYSETTDIWTKVSEFPQAKGRVYTAMQSLQNKLVIFGGHDTTGLYFNDVWFFDEANGFTQGPSMPSTARKGGMSFSNGNKFYYTCGLSAAQSRLKEAWLLDVPVGLNEDKLAERTLIYPNPFTEKVIIATGDGRAYTIEITNSLGELMYSNNAAGYAELDLSGINKEMYFIKLKYASCTTIKKLVKE